jgi:DNA-binding CsgD family transcriptional regulator
MNNTSFEELRMLLQDLLPPQNDYIPVVKQHVQETQLNKLYENIADETFYFVFDLLNCKIEYAKGVEKWLGYPDKEFSVQRYLNCVAPEQTVQFNMIAHNMYRLLCNGIFRLKFYTQQYISFIALKHYNGEYLMFKKTTSVFQFDNKNRLLAQLNVFSKWGEYQGTPLNTRITETDGFQKDNFEKAVFEMTLKNFMKKRIFSPKEFEVLKYYAVNNEINSKQLAGLLNIDLQTLYTHNKKILEKAEDTFTHSFSNAKEVASYLRKEKIL